MPQLNITEGTNVIVSFNRGPLNNGSVSGANGQLQYNNNGVFGGVPSVTVNGGNVTVADISNLKINGGIPGQVITTDGAGNLIFANAATGNGVPNGPDFSVQVANNGNFYGEFDFRYIPGTKTLYAPSVVTSSVETTAITTDIIAVSAAAFFPVLNNIHIMGGANGQVLTTDGTGNLEWTSLPIVEDTPPAGSNTQIQFNDNGVFGADPEFYYNKSSNTLNAVHISAENFYGNGENLYDINGANVFGVVPLANFAFWSGNASSAESANTANSAATAGIVTEPYQPNIVRVGTLEQLTVEGVINLNDLSNIHITGGNAGEVLTTDGTGNLYWSLGGGGGGGNVVLQPRTDYTVTNDGALQSFVNPYIEPFPGQDYASVYVDGVLLNKTEYIISDNSILVNRFLNVGDTLTIGAIGSGGSGGSVPSGYPTLNGNANTYLNGSGQWTEIINTQKEIQLEFDTSFVGTVPVGVVPAGSILSGVRVIIINAFGPTAQISVAETGNSGTLMAVGDNLPSVVGSYSTEPAIKYSTQTELSVTVAPGGFVGNGLVFISYQ